MANTLKLFRDGAVGFIDWLDGYLPRIHSGTMTNAINATYKVQPHTHDHSNTRRMWPTRTTPLCGSVSNAPLITYLVRRQLV